MASLFSIGLAAIALQQQLVTAISLDTNSTSSIKSAASTIAFGLQSWYSNNASGADPTAVGTFPGPIYWWESGAAWGGMVDYWAYTNDTSYVNVTSQALMAQVGPDYNYMPPAYYSSLGNDDQSFWAFAVLSAQEYGFPVPEGQNETIWLDLATAVWNTQAARWDTTSCAGGLKWQIFQSNNGYDYKNSISNGAFFQTSARLARYTGNQTYVDWAVKTWDWMSAVGLISPNYDVYDGSDDTINCTGIDHTQWTYNPAVLLYGTAMLANYTDDTLWKNRTNDLLTSIETLFFSPYPNSTNIMYEAACEPENTCDTDQFSFKAYMSRWLAKAASVYPGLQPSIRKYLAATATAVAKSCSGGTNNQTCGQKWYVGGYDGSYGVGQELSALETVQALLILDPGNSSTAILPGHQRNISISVVPVTSTFTLNPTSPAKDPSNPAGSPTATSKPGTNTASRKNVPAAWTTGFGTVMLTGLSMAFGSGIGALRL